MIIHVDIVMGNTRKKKNGCVVLHVRYGSMKSLFLCEMVEVLISH